MTGNAVLPDVSATSPFFSIVTVVLNDKAGFNKTANSVRQQNYTNWQWIVVDGGSTDGTLQDIEALADGRCVWMSEKDRGIYEAMNKGLRLAQGEYIIFMNAGDEFAGSDVLEQVANAIVKSGQSADLVFGGACERTRDGQLLSKAARPASTVSYGMFTHHQAMFYKREAVAQIQFDPSFVIAGDYDFTCRLLLKGGRDLQLPFPICIFSRGGLSIKRAAIGRREVLRVQEYVLRLNAFKRMRNHAAFVVSNLMQNHMRSTYDRIRFR